MNTMPNSEQFRKMQKIYNDVIGKGSKVQVSARTVAPANVLWRQKEYQMGIQGLMTGTYAPQSTGGEKQQPAYSNVAQ